MTSTLSRTFIATLTMALSASATSAADAPKAAVSTAPTMAAEYLAYPGDFPSKVMAVQTASRIVLEVAVWTGMARVFTVTVPDIDTPRTSADAPRCEREMAAKAITFAQKFLSNSKQVLARDIRMHNTAEDAAKASIVTDSGTLADALKAEGLARNSNQADAPWCTDK